MKQLLFIIILLLFLFINIIKAELNTSNMIIIYFTRTGNTELFSDYIKEIINIDSYKIIPVNPYPKDSQEMTNLAKKEYAENFRPEIKDPIINITKYKKILLGYPLWNSHIPNIIISQLVKLKLLGTTIYPFNTNEGSGIGNSIVDIKLYSLGAIVKNGFSLKGSKIKTDKESCIKEIKVWLKNSFGYEYNFKKKIEVKLLLIVIIFILIF